MSLSVYSSIAQRIAGLPKPTVVGIGGGVSAGKSTIAEILRANLPDSVVVSADGFLFPNAVLEARGLMDRKGFPESYDAARLSGFLEDIRARRPTRLPTYSHVVYDVLPDERELEPPDILILEGIVALQPPYADHLDLKIYVDAEESSLREWFLARFRQLRVTADQDSFFARFAAMPEAEALAIAEWAWDEINAPNLRLHILPTRENADLVVRKANDHRVIEVIGPAE